PPPPPPPHRLFSPKRLISRESSACRGRGDVYKTPPQPDAPARPPRRRAKRRPPRPPPRDRDGAPRAGRH
ncbi:hypothetical protein ACVGXP_23450, partial [Enterobacter hormaechei]